MQAARAWAKRDEEFVKRAGFTLIATRAVHDRTSPDRTFTAWFPTIRRGATDDRNYVKKAVSWALRQIGKRNLALNAAAIAEAETLAASAGDMHTMDRTRRAPRAPARRDAAAAPGAQRLAAAGADHGVGLDLDLPARVQERRHDHHRRRRPDLAEHLTVDASDLGPVLRVRSGTSASAPRRPVPRRAT